ncbi:type II toxin-antitoxin system RelE/ParE family toxin [Catalinimonas sp. 4WD22]|uniref:type II toxin-antitoxin system RelE family toxin n=1 Tax=Catalinimonas locisalis TaxID=3133978 RepID=UPI0031010CF1
MNVRIDKSFEKDIKKIKDKKLLTKIADTIEQAQAAISSDAIKNIKKLKGSNSYYRIRIGNYRIGIAVEGDTIDFIRFLPRKDIYKYFP